MPWHEITLLESIWRPMAAVAEPTNPSSLVLAFVGWARISATRFWCDLGMSAIDRSIWIFLWRNRKRPRSRQKLQQKIDVWLNGHNRLASTVPVPRLPKRQEINPRRDRTTGPTVRSRSPDSDRLPASADSH